MHRTSDGHFFLTDNKAMTAWNNALKFIPPRPRPNKSWNPGYAIKPMRAGTPDTPLVKTPKYRRLHTCIKTQTRLSLPLTTDQSMAVRLLSTTTKQKVTVTPTTNSVGYMLKMTKVYARRPAVPEWRFTRFGCQIKTIKTFEMFKLNQRQ